MPLQVGLTALARRQNTDLPDDPQALYDALNAAFAIAASGIYTLSEVLDLVGQVRDRMPVPSPSPTPSSSALCMSPPRQVIAHARRTQYIPSASVGGADG